MFGDALAYQSIEIDNLARFVTPGLIRALTSANEGEAIHRFRPHLTQAKTLGIAIPGPLVANAFDSNEGLK
jgi:hypothetical protein